MLSKQACIPMPSRWRASAYEGRDQVCELPPDSSRYTAPGRSLYAKRLELDPYALKAMWRVSGDLNRVQPLRG